MKKRDWKKIKTKNNYPADEVISALQKDIRRGKVDQSAYWAYELCISGMENKFWERILTIAVEDVGFGNPNATVVVQALKSAYKYEYEHEDDKLIQAIFAAAFLADSEKDRYIDEIKNYYKLSKKKPVIPDYALDKHTKRGKMKGRDDKHFWTIAAKLNPELKTRNKEYLKRVKKLLGL